MRTFKGEKIKYWKQPFVRGCSLYIYFSSIVNKFHSLMIRKLLLRVCLFVDFFIKATPLLLYKVVKDWTLIYSTLLYSNQLYYTILYSTQLYSDLLQSTPCHYFELIIQPYVQVAAQRFVFLGAAEQPICNMNDVASVLRKGAPYILLFASSLLHTQSAYLLLICHFSFS